MSISGAQNKGIFDYIFCLLSARLSFSNQSTETGALNIESALQNGGQKTNNKSKVTHADTNPVWPTHHACAQPFHPVN